MTAITRLYTAERYGPARRPGRAPDERQTEVVDRAWLRTRANILRRYLRRWIPFAKKE